MVITLTGGNSFGLKQRLDELTAGFLVAENDLALQRMDGAESQFSEVLDAVASVPFLASKKMVIIRELSANKQAADNVEQIFDSTAPTTDLIIYEPTLDKRSAYYKLLKNRTQFEEFEQLDGGRLRGWLVGEAEKAGGTLSLADANYLIDRVGTNQAILYNELQKLLTFKQHISRQDIELLTEKTPQSKIFDLLDKAFSGDKHQALKLYEEQRAQKVEPQYILALITWQLNLLALAVFGHSKSAEQIAKEAKVGSYPASKAKTLSDKLSPSKLSTLIHDAAQIDFDAKTSTYDLDEALKNYIISL